MRVAALLVLSLSVFCASALAAQQTAVSVDRAADDLDRHYNDLRSLRAASTETYSGAGITRTESGTLWLSRPGKMRWE